VQSKMKAAIGNCCVTAYQAACRDLQRYAGRKRRWGQTTGATRNPRHANGWDARPASQPRIAYEFAILAAAQDVTFELAGTAVNSAR
jgi:hypothetical protein